MNDVWLPGTKTLKPLWEKTRERTLHMSTLPLQIGPVKYHLKTFVDAYQHWTLWISSNEEAALVGELTYSKKTEERHKKPLHKVNL